MAESLYVLFAEPIPTSTCTGPGTVLTHAVETIDNDRAGSDVAVVGSDARSGPPGTRLTEAVETVDDDSAILDSTLVSNPDPRPSPGSVLTATVETTDETSLTILPLRLSD